MSHILSEFLYFIRRYYNFGIIRFLRHLGIKWYQDCLNWLSLSQDMAVWNPITFFAYAKNNRFLLKKEKYEAEIRTMQWPFSTKFLFKSIRHHFCYKVPAVPYGELVCIGINHVILDIHIVHSFCVSHK
jgi:hypothetical protein